MIISKEVNVKTSVVLSDNEEYRYYLHKEWDETKPNLTLLMHNPSKADELIMDRSVMNVFNYAVRNDFGSLTVVNLFAYRATDPDELPNKDESYERSNDDYLNDAFKDADLILVAWIRNEHKTRKREVERLLNQYSSKLKCFKDQHGKYPVHPVNLNQDTWALVDYEFYKV